MNRLSGGDLSDLGDSRRRLGRRRNGSPNMIMRAQYSSFQPPYFVVSYIYYYPWLEDPSSHGPASSLNPLAFGNGVYYGNWWNQPLSRFAYSGDYMLGYMGSPWVVVDVPAPYNSSIQHHRINRRRSPSNHRSGSSSSSGAARLPPPPSQAARRCNATRPCSRETRLISNRALEDHPPQASTDLASGLLTALNITETSTSHGSNNREAEDGDVHGGRETSITMDQGNLDLMIALARSDPELSSESILRMITVRTSQQPSTSQGDQAPDPCIICLNNLNHEPVVRRLNCGHEYHLDCIETWLQQKRECPICRSRE
ncbi:hypothetical protein SAY86_029594 [Trapa natans]|uniref:RING-type E3 ubiquitin transferase n=1 Tax=Trapa natans TaxID=22666 RepID=A0AAN7RHH4_TRANT|nr:hypothetical protein SAY86_029594 [Trapa natans]